jgi:N-acetylneuraminic acid mutarotase
MSVLSRNRVICFTAALALSASALLAATPAARTETRMVYDPVSTDIILYGGETALDPGTKTSYSLSDTWSWNGSRWTQLFPAHNPGGRSAYSFVYDTNRNRALLFGGHGGTSYFNDTWQYQNGDWSKIDTPNAPSARVLAGSAFDPIRDRMIVFGGLELSSDKKTFTNLFDTWEFDGTTWTQRATTGPSVAKPLLVYDAARNEVLMMATSTATDLKVLMYRYKPATATWEEITPATRPSCITEGAMIYVPSNQTVFLTGGVCGTTTVLEDTYQWNGTDWTKIDVKTHAGLALGQALAYDEVHKTVVQFGGTEVLGAPNANTFIFRDTDPAAIGWTSFVDHSTPGARSLFVLRGDAQNNALWLFGGFNADSAFNDVWKLQNGAWAAVTTTGGPTVACTTPSGAYDANRGKLVVLCADSTTFEWDGSAWKKYEFDDKHRPPARTLSSMTYDANIKKIVMFGGFSDPNYLDQTWTFDGATWTRVKNNPAPARALTAMWFDPIKNRTLIYGGIGRQQSTDRISRYGDMWSFDGSGWAEVKPAATPGTRYGAQVGVDPVTKKTVLFGGLRVEVNGTLQTQVYADDTWEWDGTNWSKITTTTTPPARENGFLDWDPSRNALTLFGGYSGFYHSDVWTYQNGTWTLLKEAPVGRRRVTK